MCIHQYLQNWKATFSDVRPIAKLVAYGNLQFWRIVVCSVLLGSSAIASSRLMGAFWFVFAYYLPTMSHDVKCLDTCVCVTGLSLKSQELTAIFLAVRLYCSFVMEYDIHTLLDSATFITTAWVIYTMRFKLKSTLMEDLDNLPLHYVVCLLVLLGGFIH